MAKTTASHDTDVDPQEVRRAQALWAEVTKWTTRSVLAVVATLVLMAWFLL